MKKRFHKLKTWLATGLLLANYFAGAQTYPFPQNTTYSYGLIPSNRNSADAMAAYTSWKNTYVVAAACGGTGGLRVTFDDPGNGGRVTPASNGSVSEGIGYGMLLSAYYGDKATFDGLWGYYKYWKNPSTGLMNWIINACTGVVQANAATDADLDAAWALYVAHWQWGNGISSQYLTDCKTQIAAIKAHEIEAGTYLLKPGDAFGGSAGGNNDLVNLSYFSPAYFTEFGNITNDQTFWNNVVLNNYALLAKARNSSTGLVPDWSRGSDGGIPASGASAYKPAGGTHFYYDAVRTPFRVALDYLWHGTPQALSYTNLVNNWVQTKIVSPANLHTEYTLDGTALDPYHNNTFVGCFSASLMATDQSSNQSLVNSFYTDNKNTNPASSGAYFNASWKAMSLLLQTGNFYLPPPDLCQEPYLNASYDLCSPDPQILDPQIPAGTYQWKLNGTVIAGATSQTYKATAPGNYEVAVTVQVNGKPCVRRAATIVNPATPTAKFAFVASGLSVNLSDNSSTGLTKYEWTFGSGASPASYTVTRPDTQNLNPTTQYSGPGLKLITLKVTDGCGNTNTSTQEITIGDPNSTAGGWFANNFQEAIYPGQGSNSNVVITSTLNGSTANPNITLDNTTSCKFFRAVVSASAGYYDPISIGFKDPTLNNKNSIKPIDITTYPYVRFRMRVNRSIDSIRVVLQDSSYKQATDWKPVYLKGERKADGTYNPIPVNTWFISTLDFTGRFFMGTAKTPVNSKIISQIQFEPFAANDPVAFPSAKPRSAITVDIDWVIVGNMAFPAPDLSAASSPITFCQGGSADIGIDSCTVEVDNVSWSNGATTPLQTVTSTGLYTITATNFGGQTSKDIQVTVIPYSKAKFVYTTPTTSSVSVVDSSTGINKSWTWYKNPLIATSPGTVGTNNNTATKLPGGGQTPSAFTGLVEGDVVCLVLAPGGCYHDPAHDKGYCTKITFVTTGLDDFNSTTTNVYPTLTDGYLNILLGGNLSGSFDIRISDIAGAVHYSSSIGAGLSSVDVSSLPSGTYILNLKQEGKTMVKKFIKQ